MEIIHISAECYPVAKVGGLADVVGALPKYQNQLRHFAKVVMPMYRTPFLEKNEFELVHEGGVWVGNTWRHFSVIREKTNKLGFDLFLVDIPGLLDRSSPYGHADDAERFVGFQIAVLNWLSQWVDLPDVVHCHDHHTGLIPFLMKYGRSYGRLREVSTVFTIHNAQYQGWLGWDRAYWLPAYDDWKSGLLDWNQVINSMACAVRCADKVTTVSPGYLEEIKQSARGLEALFNYEMGKCVGILNGIDTEVWDPWTDPMIKKNYNRRNVTSGKKANKVALCKEFRLDARKPLVSFIGRLVDDKGADLLPTIIAESIQENGGEVNFLVLGSGDSITESRLLQLKKNFGKNFGLHLGYNEELSHRVYAGSDFLLMPSRVEPCGLNQLYSLRYGTIPIVSSVGGLRDTVRDFGEEEGYGIRYLMPEIWDIKRAIKRGLDHIHDNQLIFKLRKKMMGLDFSWKQSAKTYIQLYQSIK